MIVMVMVISSWNIQVIVMVFDFIKDVIATTLVYMYLRLLVLCVHEPQVVSIVCT